MNLYVHKESSAGAPDRIAISDENELATQNHFQQLFPLDNDRQGVTVPMYLFKAVQAGHTRVWRAVSGIWGVLDKTYQELATFRSETNNKFDETNKLLKRLLNVVEGGETPPALDKVPLVLPAPEKSNQGGQTAFQATSAPGQQVGDFARYEDVKFVDSLVEMHNYERIKLL